MYKRSVEEMNLLDDFLFGKMVTYPEIGEKFSRELLKVIINKDFTKLKVVPQKIYYGSDNEHHGTRLDVYLEEEGETMVIPSEDESIYDLEVDKNNKKKSIQVLPRRVRFYHAKIDSVSLKSGESYRNLKSVIVIMIMPYDPFGQNRMVYTIRNLCEEKPEMTYDDGAKTLFLYTKGIEGNPSRKLKQLLHYMEQTEEENAMNDSLKAIQKMVEVVKTDEEVSLEYMKIFEREEMLLEEGIEQGIEQGRAEERANTQKRKRVRINFRRRWISLRKS